MSTENKLPADFKAKWVEALRSGKYTQGRSKLYDRANNTFCCLGVCGVVAGIDTAEMAYRSFYPIGQGYGFDGVPKVLRGSEVYETAFTLASMNDGGSTFEEIADYIVQNL